MRTLIMIQLVYEKEVIATQTWANYYLKSINSMVDKISEKYRNLLFEEPHCDIVDPDDGREVILRIDVDCSPGEQFNIKRYAECCARSIGFRAGGKASSSLSADELFERKWWQIIKYSVSKSVFRFLLYPIVAGFLFAVYQFFFRSIYDFGGKSEKLVLSPIKTFTDSNLSTNDKQKIHYTRTDWDGHFVPEEIIHLGYIYINRFWIDPIEHVALLSITTYQSGQEKFVQTNNFSITRDSMIIDCEVPNEGNLIIRGSFKRNDTTGICDYLDAFFFYSTVKTQTFVTRYKCNHTAP